MECIALDVEGLHLGIADLDALLVGRGIERALDFQAALVVVAAISSTTVNRLSAAGRATSV
jgi:hypothetical protein